MCVGLLLLTAVCGVIALFVYDLPDFSEPTKGFDARGTDISGRMFSFNNIYSELSLVHTRNDSRTSMNEASRFDNLTTNHRTGRIRRDVTSNNSDIEPGIQFCNFDFGFGGSYGQPAIVFEAIGYNKLFSSEALKSVCSQYDNHIGRNSEMQARCCRKSNGHCSDSRSLANYVALLSGRDSCRDIRDSDVANVKILLEKCAPYYQRKALKYCEDGSSVCPPDVPSECLAFDHAIHFIFQYLVPATFAAQANSGNFDLSSTILFVPYIGYTRDIYESALQGKHISDGITVVVALGFGSLKYALFRDFLLSDTLYMGLGAGFVFVIIWIYTGSLIITIMTIVSMLMSLIMAYFAFVVIFRLPFFPFVNIASAVLVIGIGADDTFVYVDIWRQMKSAYASAPPSLVLRNTLNHAAVTMFVTSFTTASALYSSFISSITAVRCFGVYGGTAILINFIFTLTWLPATVVIHSHFQDWCAKFTYPCQGCLQKLYAAHSIIATAYRRVFDYILPTLVLKLRYAWIVILASVGVGAFCTMYITPKLRLPTTAEFQVFQDDNLFERYDSVYKSKFYFNIEENNPLFISAVFGVDSVDNGDHWNPDDTGSLVLEETFNIFHSDAQQWLLEFCHSFHKQNFSGQRETNECFMDSFRKIMSAPCSAGTDAIPSPCCGQTIFPFPADLFEKCVKMSRRCDWATSLCPGNSLPFTGPLFSKVDGSVKGFMMYEISSRMDTMDFKSIDEFWTEINEWFDRSLKTKPEGITGGWLYAGSTWHSSGQQLYFYNLQKSLATDTPISMGLSLAIAGVVLLLTTRNILISLYAMLSIAGAFSLTVGTLVLLGWRLNIFESAILTLAIGLSVDFTIHYGVAYRLAPSNLREDRTLSSLTAVGSAIAIAAFSTFVAGALMMPSSVITYVQLGIFLMLVMTMSWIYATFFFLSICRVIGPQGQCAQIPSPLSCF
ncbi:protein dispatched homolog 1-like isoform X2 [Acanthaster planci]|nr:protein dispatched homolog 1-like isoform X2 [Acanthaster planci]XP_022109847.1 protein dispatched homolog 1-like isoform X2 [Acanthaster planci]